jgi:hypothetical protein
MNKSKLLAFVGGSTLLAIAGVALAATSYAPATLVVSKPAQPASGIAPAGALRVRFTAFNLTAIGSDIMVDSVTVVQSGVADDEAFDGILLLVNGEAATDDKPLRDQTVTFTDGLLIPRGETFHLMVAANMAEDLEEFDGQMPRFTVTDIKASTPIEIH